jgi:DNA-binding transcriptional LysR family regulator
MELRHLRYFVAVAEELHFRRAAERLHMSQPPLSEQIRHLENEFGVRLLERSRRGVEMTAAGETFLRQALSVLESVDRAVDQTRRVARGEVGQVFVGFVPSAMDGSLPEILRQQRARYPEVELELREMSTSHQIEALRAGRIDAGFIRPPVEHDGLEVEVIQREAIVVVLPSNHPLAQRQEIHPGDLRGETLIVIARAEAPGLHLSLADAIVQIAGPRTVKEVTRAQTALGLVVAGLGVSLLPASVASSHRDGLTFVQFAQGEPAIELAIAWRPPAAPPVQAFLDSVRSQDLGQPG